MADQEKPGKPGKPPTEVSDQAAPAPLKPTRIAQMEQGLRAFHEAEQLNETLRNQLEETRRDLKAREMEVASLNERIVTLRDDHAATLNATESRCTAAQAERDRAVSEATALKAFIASMKAVWDRIPQ
jgi:hypothetical protein